MKITPLLSGRRVRKSHWKEGEWEKVLFVAPNDYWIGVNSSGKEFFMLVSEWDNEYELLYKHIPLSKEKPTHDEDGEPLEDYNGHGTTQDQET